MTLYTKTLAGVLVALVLIPVLEKQGKDMGLVLTAAVCCMMAGTVFSFMEPVTDFFYQLRQDTGMDPEILKTLLKLVGIGLTGEIVTVLCADAGSSALGKGLQLLTSALILFLSLPVLRSLTALIREILGGL